jgi:RNA polymerase sigma-70 factor (ECF subfamily)
MMGGPVTESAQRRRPVLVEGTPDSGHPGRLRAAFRAHAGSVYATAHRILADAADAEDVTQTVFETLARRGDTLRDGDRLGAFLRACAVRECLMLLRRRRWWWGKRGRRVTAPAPIEDAPAEAFLLTAVRELLGPLSPEERAAVVLKLVEECSHEEVAALMGISVATARRRLATARRRMLAHARDDVQRDLVDEMEVSE